MVSPSCQVRRKSPEIFSGSRPAPASAGAWACRDAPWPNASSPRPRQNRTKAGRSRRIATERREGVSPGTRVLVWPKTQGRGGRQDDRQGNPVRGGLLKPAAGGSGPRKGTARGRRTLKGTGLLGEVCRGVNWNIRRLFPLLQLAPFLEFPVCLTHADTPGTWRTGLVPLENGAAKTVQRTQCGHPALP